MNDNDYGTVRKVLVAGLSLVSVKVVAVAFVVLLLVIVLFGSSPASSEGPEASGAAGDIPDVALEAYRQGATFCDEIEWPVLAGIGQIESHHGGLYGGVFDEEGFLSPPIFGVQLSGSGVGGNLTPYPIGEWQGRWGLQGPYQQAMGPMQFMPGTWDRLGTDADGDGVEDPQNIFDAAASAARLLCEGFTDLASAIKRYNNSDEYVADVLREAALYTEGGGTGSDDAGELVDNPNLCLADRARQDLEAGIVDRRLVAALAGAAEEFTICVGWFRTGHKACVGGTGTYPDCRLSQHWFGRAADITHVDGELVHPGNGSARRLADWWWDSFGGVPPDSLGSPWPEAFGFTDANHQDHLHVAYFEGTSSGPRAPGVVAEPTATPVPAPRTMITDLYDQGGALGQAAAATTDANTLSETIAARTAQVAVAGTSGTASPDAEIGRTDGWGTEPGAGPHGLRDATPEASEGVGPVEAAVDPANLQAAVDGRLGGEVIRLVAGEYGPLSIVGLAPVTIVGPERGRARFSNASGAAITVLGGVSVSLEGLTVADSQQGVVGFDSWLRLANVEFGGIGGAAVSTRGGAVTITDGVVSIVGSGLVVSDGSAVVADSLFRGVAGNSIVTSGTSDLVASDNVFLGSGADAIVGAPLTTATVVRNLIGDVRSGVSVTVAGSATVAGNLIWGNSDTAIMAMGTGAVVNNVVIDGVVWAAPGVSQNANLLGDDARARVPRGWVEGAAATAEVRRLLLELSP